MRAIQIEPRGRARCGACRQSAQQLCVRGWRGHLRFLPIDAVRGHSLKRKGTPPQLESLPNGLRVLRSISAYEGASTHDCRGATSGSPVDTVPAIRPARLFACADRNLQKGCSRACGARRLASSRFGCGDCSVLPIQSQPDLSASKEEPVPNHRPSACRPRFQLALSLASEASS